MKTGYFITLGMLSCVCSVAPESVSRKVGESVTLHTGETKQQRDTILWYFNGTRIAQINGDPSQSCLYDGESGIFRDRLEVDYETGSLNITNITAEHTGRYEAEIIRSQSTGTSHTLNRNPKCDRTKVTRKTNNMVDNIKIYNVAVSGPEKSNESTEEEPQDSYKNSRLSAGAIAGISVAAFVLLLIVVCAVIYCHRQKAKSEVV